MATLIRHRVLALGLLAAAGCGAPSGPAPSSGADASPPSIAEARGTLAEFRARQTSEDAPEEVATPGSLAEAYALVLQDRFPSFDAALRYAEGQQGADALALRAWVHLSRAGAHRLVADILRERATRLDADARPLERRAEDDPDAGRRAEAMRATAADLRRVVAALETLREDALTQGEELARETVRRHPAARQGHVALADVHLERGDWPAFDSEIRAAEAMGEPTAALRLLRAFEALHRYRDRAAARALFDEALVLEPDLARASAVRVFLEDEPAARHEALEALRATAPRHPVVILAGPTLDAERAAAASAAR